MPPIGLLQQALGFFPGRFVVVRRAVAVGVVLGFLGVAAGFGGLAGVQGQAGQEVVDLGSVEAELAAVGDGEGSLCGRAVLVEARQGKQDGGGSGPDAWRLAFSLIRPFQQNLFSAQRNRLYKRKDINFSHLSTK